MNEKRIKECIFCKEKTQPTYTDVTALRRFLSDRSRIVPRARTGTCAKHQRQLAKAVKHARHLSLLPFTPGV